MGEQQKKPTSFRVNPELLKAVQKACIDRGTNVTAVIEQGMRNWLSENPQGEPAGPFSRFMDQLSLDQKVLLEKIAAKLDRRYPDRKGVEAALRFIADAPKK